MQTEKLSLKNIKNVLSMAELKKSWLAAQVVVEPTKLFVANVREIGATQQ